MNKPSKNPLRRPCAVEAYWAYYVRRAERTHKSIVRWSLILTLLCGIEIFRMSYLTFMRHGLWAGFVVNYLVLAVGGAAVIVMVCLVRDSTRGTGKTGEILKKLD